MISYAYGEQNQPKLKKLLCISLKIIAVISLLSAAASFCFTRPLVAVFTDIENPVYGLAVRGNRICTVALLFLGFNIFASGLFTALSNGVVSAVLAFSRSFVFMLAAMLLLPALFGVTGIWLATPAAELMALLLSAGMLIRHKMYFTVDATEKGEERAIYSR